MQLQWVRQFLNIWLLWDTAYYPCDSSSDLLCLSLHSCLQFTHVSFLSSFANQNIARDLWGSSFVVLLTRTSSFLAGLERCHLGWLEIKAVILSHPSVWFTIPPQIVIITVKCSKTVHWNSASICSAVHKSKLHMHASLLLSHNFFLICHSCPASSCCLPYFCRAWRDVCFLFHLCPPPKDTSYRYILFAKTRAARDPVGYEAA